jgi:DNA-binding NarL/FixJ family response regulator
MTATKGRARIFLVDDHPAVRHGLTRLLGDDQYEVCGEKGSLAKTLEAIVDSKADLAIVDLSLGDESGFDLIAELSVHKIPVLVYSMHEDASSIDQSLRAGASGYVSKREESDVLCLAVQKLLNGQRYLAPYAAKALADRGESLGDNGDTAKLSEREQQIMAQFGLGCGPSDVAEALSISVRTVEGYCSRIIDKLGLSNMKELRQHAIRKRQ